MQARWHSEGSGQGASLRPVFLLCSARLHRGGAGGGGNDSSSYQLRIEQDLEDGTYHDDDEEPGSLTIDVGDIVGEASAACSTSTLHSLPWYGLSQHVALGMR